MIGVNLDDVRRHLALIWRPGDVFELRALSKERGRQVIQSGFFDEPDAFAAAAGARSGKVDGAYITLNPVNPALLARLPKNRLHVAGAGDTTSDRDVQLRRHLLVDVDAVRPAGISSTNEEHDAAVALARDIRDALDADGWPEPLFADSGNGAHLIYAVDLPAADGDLVKHALEELARRYSTPTIKVDGKVFNPARISKIYGTLTRKGEDTPERPHRLARIISAPAALATLERAVLGRFVPAVRASTPGPRPGPAARAFDLDAWIAEHCPQAVERPWASGRKWIFPVCPFDDSHAPDKAYITQGHDGKRSAGCMRESCSLKSWRDLREHFEPHAYDYEGPRHVRPVNGHRLTDREPPPADDRDVPQATADRDGKPANATRRGRDVRKRGPEIIAEIEERKDERLVPLKLGPDALVSTYLGSIVLLNGGTGAGKTSLALQVAIGHAVEVGPAIVASLELPKRIIGGRAVGIRCDESWSGVLTGRIPSEHMLGQWPGRLTVIERRDFTIDNLHASLAASREEHPDEPPLVVVDYVQVMNNDEREIRRRVARAMEQLDEIAQEHRAVVLALSQGSRASSRQLASGEKVGADTADAGAEAAELERWSTFTIAIGGHGPPDEHGWSAVDLSIGKGRIGGGDTVAPSRCCGRTGAWRLAGGARPAGEVKAEKKAATDAGKVRALAHAVAGFLARAVEPQSRREIRAEVGGNDTTVRAACVLLLDDVESGVVEVGPKVKGAWKLWTRTAAGQAGRNIVPRVLRSPDVE